MIEIERENLPQQEVVGKITSLAHDSLCRMNAATAKFYSFTFLETRGKWQGGWCWSNDPFDGEEYTYHMHTKKFYRKEDED